MYLPEVQDSRYEWSVTLDWLVRVEESLIHSPRSFLISGYNLGFEGSLESEALFCFCLILYHLKTLHNGENRRPFYPP